MLVKWSYFVGEVLDGVNDLFSLYCPQVLLCLNLECRGNFKTHKNSVQERDFYGEFFDAIDHIPKTFVGEALGYWIGIFDLQKSPDQREELCYR